MTATPDVRKFELRLRVSWQNPRTERTNRTDFLVKFTQEAQVSDLVGILCFQVQLDPDVHVIVRQMARLPDGQTTDVTLQMHAPLMSQGLVDGTELMVHPRLGAPPMLNMGDEPDGRAIILIDESGTHRGRMTAISKGQRLVASATYDGHGLIVDDKRLVDGELILIARESNVEIQWSSESLVLLVSGERQQAGTCVAPVGSMVALASIEDVDDVRVSWLVTTARHTQTRSPFGRVRYEPRARTDHPTFPAMPERYGSLPSWPVRPDDPPFPLDQVVLPGMMALALFAVTNSPYMLFTLPIALAGSVWAWSRSRRIMDQKHGKQVEAWRKTSLDVIQAVRKHAVEEMTNLDHEAPDSLFWTREAFRRRRGLWSRSVDDADFLTIRLGAGNQLSRYSTSVPEGYNFDDDEISRALVETAFKVSAHSVTPRLVDSTVPFQLVDANIAIVGPRSRVSASATDVLLQLCCSHSPTSVVIAMLIPEAQQESWKWLRWLPHLTSPTPLQPDYRFAVGTEAANAFLAEIIKTVETREVLSKDGQRQRHHMILVVQESVQVDVGLLSTAIAASKGALHLLWLGSGRDQVPPACQWTMSIDDTPGTEQVEAALRGPLHSDYLRLTTRTYRGDPGLLARSLAPLYDPHAAGSDASMPAEVPLSSVIDLDDVAWGERADESLNLLLGLTSSGPLELDLVKDGPHLLVGGTTGSGKSEFLQALVCSVISDFAPEEVSLFLIDYKFGSTFGEFKDIPHCAGFVSDQDGDNITRAIRFLQAELRRRQVLFEKAGDAKEFKDYRAAMRLDEELPPLPRLLVVFDEFETLVSVSEQSRGRIGALDAVIDIARRGRSYGVHLVLATQSPRSDVVVPKIRSNVRAKVALATISRSDSETIIDSGEAALIPRSRPGRALLRLEGTVLQEFQSPYAGFKRGPAHDETKIQVLRLFSKLGPSKVSTPSMEHRRQTDLDEDKKRAEFVHLIESVNELSEHHLGKAPAPSKQPMPRLHPSLFENPKLEKSGLDPAYIGLIDEPEKMRITGLEAKFDRGAVVVTGAVGTGKTTACLTVAEQWLLAHPRPAVFAFCDDDTLAGLAKKQGHAWTIVNSANFVDVSRALDLLRRVNPANTDGILVIVDGLERLLGFQSDHRRAQHWGEQLTELLQFSRTLGITLIVSCADGVNYQSVLGSGIGNVVRLGANYEQTGLPKEDWLPGFGLDAQDRLTQLALPGPASGSESIAILPAHDQISVDELLPSIAPATGRVCLGVEDVQNLLVWHELSESHLLVASRNRTAAQAAVRPIARQLLHGTDSRKILSPDAPPGMESMCFYPEDLVDKLHRREITDDPVKRLQNEGALVVDGRLIVILWQGIAAQNPISRGFIEHLIAADIDRVRIISVTNLGDSLRENGRTLGDQKAMLLLAPNTNQGNTDYTAVIGEGLVHRPGIRYSSEQGIFVRSSGSGHVWTLKDQAEVGR